MATHYFTQGSGNFSTLENWNTSRTGGGTSPLSVASLAGSLIDYTIQPGHIITYDIEDAEACDGSITGWGVNSHLYIHIEGSDTTPGELQLSSVPNTPGRVYYLKNGSTFSGTDGLFYGKVTGGSLENRIPSNARTVIASGMACTYLDVKLYGTEPIETTYQLTEDTAVGATTLPVVGFRHATNPMNDTEWSGSRRVANGRGLATLDATTPTGDGVLNLVTGFPSSLKAGDLIALCDRNISFKWISGSIKSGGELYEGQCTFDSVGMGYIRNVTNLTIGGKTVVGYTAGPAIKDCGNVTISGDAVITLVNAAGVSYPTSLQTIENVPDLLIKDNAVILGGYRGGRE